MVNCRTSADSGAQSRKYLIDFMVGKKSVPGACNAILTGAPHLFGEKKTIKYSVMVVIEEKQTKIFRLAVYQTEQLISKLFSVLFSFDFIKSFLFTHSCSVFSLDLLEYLQN